MSFLWRWIRKLLKFNDGNHWIRGNMFGVTHSQAKQPQMNKTPDRILVTLNIHGPHNYKRKTKETLLIPYIRLCRHNVTACKWAESRFCEVVKSCKASNYQSTYLYKTIYTISAKEQILQKFISVFIGI